MKIGLSSWIIADGNYEHFECGQRASFSLAFYPANSPLDIPRDWLSVDPPDVDRTSIRHVEGSDYMVTAKVTDVLNDWWVIDAGVPLYRAGLPPDGIKSGSWVIGKICVGVDPFDYFERFSRHRAAPALTYNWNVTKIELETTPIIESGRMKMRDRFRRGWREVNDTRAHSAGAVVDEFVLHCERENAPPRR